MGHVDEGVERVMERNVTRVMLNTNVRRIARDDRFLGFLHDHRDQIEVYLQFDSLEERPLRTLRGADLRDVRRRALENLERHGISTTLVVTVVDEPNDTGSVTSAGTSCSVSVKSPVAGPW